MPTPSKKVASAKKPGSGTVSKAASTTAAAPKAAGKARPEPSKKTIAGTGAVKPATKPAAKAAAKPAGSTAKKVPATKRPALSAEQRRSYVEVAAYYIAERRGFVGGNVAEDWVAAEAEVDRMLASGRINP